MNDTEQSKTPLQPSSATTGFPSPADDYIESRLDLNDYLVRHPAATFFVRATGDSMTGAGIFPGDILIVDRALEAGNGSIVVAVIGDNFTVKTLKKTRGRAFLLPANDLYRTIEITSEMNAEIWGVVTTVIRRMVR